MALSQALWITSAAVASVIACWYGVLAIHLWLRSRAVFGSISSEANETLRKLLDVSRQGKRLQLTRVTLLYSGIGALILALTAREWLGLVVAAAPFVLIAWMKVRTTTVPVVLILGTSTDSSIRRQRAIKRRLSPFRVVSLLNVDVPWDATLNKEMALDCFRTNNEADWWLVITRLMEIAPFLAIDSAAETSGVLREGRHILGSDLTRKCLFLTPADGSAPILDRLLPMPEERRHLRMVHYTDAPHTIATMVADLTRQRALSPKSESAHGPHNV